MDTHEVYMHRCLELAKLAAGRVAPNPMVGSVLVYNGQIIGEGFHEMYGGPHAEVNCIQSVKSEHLHLIAESTLYVSLEPCAHYGKTPPCVNLILEKQIPHVVIGTRDPFKEVNGRGIEKLKAAGVQVTVGVLQEAAQLLNKRFFIFHTMQRPFIVLKWAQSLNQKIAKEDRSRVLISNPISNRLVHKWRSEEVAIMVGRTTAQMDDPALTTRLWPGKSPVRIVLDRTLSLPNNLKLLTDAGTTIVFNTKQDKQDVAIRYIQISDYEPYLDQVMQSLYLLNIQSILIEGGATLLNSFIEEGLWDEARVITNNTLFIDNGLAAPALSNALLEKQDDLLNDSIHYYINKKS